MPKDHVHEFLREIAESETLQTELAEAKAQELTGGDLNGVSPAFFIDGDMGNIIAPDGGNNADTCHIKLLS